MYKIILLILIFYTLPAKADTVIGMVKEILPVKGSTLVFLNSRDDNKACKNKYSVIMPDSNNYLEKIKSFEGKSLILNYEIENIDTTGKYNSIRCKITNVSKH